MAKKVFGGLFLVNAVIFLFVAIMNGNFLEEDVGLWLGALIPVVLYSASGIIMLTLDSATTVNYIDGFRKRGQQVTWIIVVFVVSMVCFFILLLGAFGAATSILVPVDNFLMFFITGAVIPAAIPMIALAFMLDFTNAIAYLSCKKLFIKDSKALYEYLSTNEVFYSYAEKNALLVSNKVLFFPDSFVTIPFNGIKDINVLNVFGLKYVFFAPVNGKKFYVITKYDDKIKAAINANRQAQQEYRHF